VWLALIACTGIWLVAGAAAAFNCIVEKGIDARMKRTAWRPTARGQLSDRQTLIFSAVLGAAGSVEAIFCALAIRDGVIPPTLNLDNPSFDSPINLTPHKAVKKKVRAALSNSFGFGGHNAVAAFRSYP
jgi:hypothetical protein